MKPKLFAVFADSHSPRIHRPTWNCFLEFVSRNPVEGVIDLGDTNDNGCISHHNKSKPGKKVPGEYLLDTEFWLEEMLEPLEAAIAASQKRFKTKHVEKVQICGNHDDWEREFYEEMPELAGTLDRTKHLVSRGWKVVPFGKAYRRGKLSYVHGESLTGMYHSKKALEVYAGNMVYGHFHTLQTQTKVLSSDKKQKWSATCIPIIGECNPEYMENRPSAWVNGFAAVLYHGSEQAYNLYPIVCINGRAAWGSEVYGVQE